MTFEPDDTTDVAQLVVRRPGDDGPRYLLARRTEDGYWEFVGGKRKADESVREAARREFEEELSGVPVADATIRRVAEPYPSAVGDRFSLYPVLVDVPDSVAARIDETVLSMEHDAVSWVTPSGFDDYETLGQRTALERFDVL